MSQSDIDIALGVALAGLKLAGALYPPIAIIVPALESLVRHAHHALVAGLADGSILPDGRGGFVPASNSRYDPKTGEFL